MGSSGKSSGERTQDALDQQIYDQFYDAGLSGASYSWEGDADREIGAQMGYEAGQAARPVETASFEMPDFVSMFSEMTASTEAASEEAQAEYDAEQEALRLEEGQRLTSDAYGSYLDAAGSAVDYVNSEIDSERSNAALLGIDYTITDEQKSSRVSDYFATIWSDSNQADLQGYIDEYGNPEGFEGFSVTRGNAETYAGTKEKEEVVGASKGLKPTIATEEDEEGLGGSANVLGV